jgi:MFS transporter, DHA1 family, tetracycline resistance protein
MLHGKRAALGFIFVTVMLDMLGFGIIAPVLPKLIADLLHGDIVLTSKYMGLFVTTWAVMQLFFSPVLGMLSDRFGRRPVILIANFGLGLDYIVMALAPSVMWLFLGRVLSGITSSNLGTANAYISDITPPEQRSSAFGLIGAAFGVGFVLGPAVGGWLGATNPRLPFWVASAICLLNAIYGLFVLPESLPRGHRSQHFQWRTSNPIGALKLLTSHPQLRALALASFLGFLANEIFGTVFVLYVTFRYHWSERIVGTSLAVVGIGYMITSAVLVTPVVKRFGEKKSVYAGFGLGALGFFLFGRAKTSAFFFAAIPVNALWGLAGPPMQSLMTQTVDASQQGRLQGAIGSLEGIAMVIGPGLFSGLFATFIQPSHYAPGLPWFVAGALLLAAAVVAARVRTSAASSVAC